MKRLPTPIDSTAAALRRRQWLALLAGAPWLTGFETPGRSGAASATAAPAAPSLAAAAPAPLVAAPAPAGEGTMQVLSMPAPGLGVNDDPIRIHAWRPARWRPEDPVAVVMHGTNRDADRYLRNWTEPADEAGILVLVPEFTREKFPNRAFYNFGHVVDEQMTLRPPERWSFRVVDDAFDLARKAFGARRERYGLYGHSAGAQFVHRYLLMAQASRAELIVTANAGSYTLPDRSAPFPWGLANVPAVGPEQLARAFARPVVVLLGEDDIDPAHRTLPSDPEAQAQGPHRLARGRNFFAAATRAAAELKVPLRWRLQTVPGVGHSDRAMAPVAMGLLRSAA